MPVMMGLGFWCGAGYSRVLGAARGAAVVAAVAHRGSGDEAAEIILQQNGVEVHEQSNLAAAETEVCAGLRFVYRQDALDRLEFQKNGLRYDDVGEVALVQADVFVDDGEGDLALKFKVAVPSRGSGDRPPRANLGRACGAP
jgi:hypothetical protein